MATEGVCNICDNLAEYGPDAAFPARHCPRCGDFVYDASLEFPKPTSPDEMVRLSGWVREQNEAGVVPVRITPDTSRRVAQMRLPALRERASRVLALLARDCPRTDVWFLQDTAAHDLELQGVSYSKNHQDALLLIEILIEEGCLRPGPAGCALAVKGLLATEALGRSKSGSAQGFVAMSFDESLRDVWTNGFDPGIRAAGFRPVRLDNEDYVGGITDEIMAQIKRSRFVVADYTSERNSVYFEAGFALGLGLIVIPTCRADGISALHFDIKHLNTLPWNTPAELADGLNRRIRAVIGAGPDDPDPS
jgi:hypothetical protein